MSNAREKLNVIEKELSDYEILKNNLKELRNAYSNLGKAFHKKAGNTIYDLQLKDEYITKGNLNMNFANSITRLLNGENIENILTFIKVPQKYLKED